MAREGIASKAKPGRERRVARRTLARLNQCSRPTIRDDRRDDIRRA